MTKRRVYNLAGGFLGEFVHRQLLTTRDNLGVAPAGVIVPADDLLWSAPRPMIVAIRPPFRVQSVARFFSAGSATMRFPIGHIFSSRSPIQIAGRVVCHVTVAVRAVRSIDWLGAYKGLADKAMRLSGGFDPRIRQHIGLIASPVSGGPQYPANAGAAMIRFIAANPASGRDRICRTFRNLAPFFHEFVLASFTFNIKERMP